MKITQELEGIEQALADTDLYTEGNKSQLQQILQQQAALNSELETVEMEWLENQELLENKKEAFDAQYSS